MSRLFRFIIPIFFLAVSGCNHSTKKLSDSVKAGSGMSISYAKGFSISAFENYRKITVLNPWQQSAGNSFEYYLVDSGKVVPADLNGKQVVRTPVKRVICLSTSHIGFLSALNEIPSLKALSGAGFASDTQVIKAIADKKIFDVGYDQGINY